MPNSKYNLDALIAQAEEMELPLTPAIKKSGAKLTALIENASIQDIPVLPTEKKKSTKNKKTKKDPFKEMIEQYYPSKDIQNPLLKAKRLIRVMVSNLDAEDMERNGTLVQVTTVRHGDLCSRYVDYGTETHCEYVGVMALKEKTYIHKEEFFDKARNAKSIRTSTRPKYNIAILPPLTEDEIKTIADRQEITLDGND